MKADQPLVNKQYLLQKFPGKGGWTYAQIPEILKNKHTPFGWVKVRGWIDNHQVKNYHLMPIGNGQLFLPVKADIRKKLKKGAGDYVQVILFADNAAIEIPEDLKLCLLDEPNALETFLSYTQGQQAAFIRWIDSAKTEETKIDRIAQTINKVAIDQTRKSIRAREL